MIDDKLMEAMNKAANEKTPEEFEYRGFKCLIRRNNIAGNLCGYVVIPKDHRLYGKTYEDDDELGNIDVHGGITWSGPFPEITDDWYIGFDCAHYRDLCPGMALLTRSSYLFEGQTYKDIDYVRQEIKNMVDQFNANKNAEG